MGLVHHDDAERSETVVSSKKDRKHSFASNVTKRGLKPGRAPD